MAIPIMIVTELIDGSSTNVFATVVSLGSNEDQKTCNQNEKQITCVRFDFLIGCYVAHTRDHL
jgi:hypothetical protein